MTDLPVWAKDKAREWLNRHSDAWHNIWVGDDEASASLAALLVEVSKQSDITCSTCGTLKIMVAGRYQDDVLAEVWRAGREVKERCDEILSRLEKL